MIQTDSFVIRYANHNDAASVTMLLRETAEWLQQKNEALWNPQSFTIEWTIHTIDKREMIVAVLNGEIAASMLIVKHDPEFWPEAKTGEALYLHKLVVKREFAGLGLAHQLINWASGQAKAANIPVLRLDCAPREKLVRVYEKAGFVSVEKEPVLISGFMVQRMELNCV